MIGGGFTGLACAANLVNKGVAVTVFESENNLGGLAEGFKGKGWKWSLEDFYHHVFTNDQDIISLAGKVGWPMTEYTPLTTSFIDNEEIQLDSPLSVLKFSKINFFSRAYMGVGLAILKLIPNGLFLEKYRVVDLLPKMIGQEAYQKIWLRLLKAKFGSQYSSVNMAWFWTRVAKRTKNLGYFKQGFQMLADKIGEYIVNSGGVISLNSRIDKSNMSATKNNKIAINDEVFDAVVVTTPAPIAKAICPSITIPKIDYLSAQTIILEMNTKLTKGYWMNVLEKKWPFLVVVEHTNMVDKKYYGGNRIVYLGNYLESDNKQLKMTKSEIISMYLPYLKLINNKFDKSWIKNSFLIRKPFAQPVFPVNYSQMLQKDFSETRSIFVANMSMVYPFDRGTNYAVRMGNEVANEVYKQLDSKND